MNRRHGTARTLAILMVVLVVILVARCERSPDDGDGSRSGSEQGRYIPSGDEGLGASVAIVVDQSGSMRDAARGDTRPKYSVARDAILEMLATTDSFIARQPGFPINVGLFAFAGKVSTLVPIAPYDREALRSALLTMPAPDGGTAIGDAMDVARQALYQSGTIRKYILVVTDGENTAGRSPESVAREIARRSDGAVKMYFVAFDIDADKFAFVRSVRGEVLGARNAVALRASLDTIYRGKILAEAVDAGETLTPKP
jgi:Mg-chelatase subunit ChlD